jgi:acyl carrier protein
MNETEIKAAVFKVLRRIAPEATLESLPSDANLRETLDIDSFDFLQFLIGLNQELHIEIPEADYPKLTTLADITDYLGKKTAREP